MTVARANLTEGKVMTPWRWAVIWEIFIIMLCNRGSGGPSNVNQSYDENIRKMDDDEKKANYQLPLYMEL